MWIKNPPIGSSTLQMSNSEEQLGVEPTTLEKYDFKVVEIMLFVICNREAISADLQSAPKPTSNYISPQRNL